MEPKIIYEEKDFVAVNKPAGLLVHPVKNQNVKGKRGERTLADWLTARYPAMKKVGDDPEFRPGIVHRLDKDTSGVILVAKTEAGFRYLKSLFQEKKIKKTYYALLFGKLLPQEGVIAKPIGIISGTTRRSVHSEKMAKEAETHYRVVKYYSAKENEKDTFSFVAASPLTGRTHQLRVHFASTGHGVVGDPLYGKKRAPDWAGRLLLHASSLELPTPRGERIKLEAELPEDFKQALAHLEESTE